MAETAVCRARTALWHGADPFQGLPTGLFQIDIQGWNSDHRYLSDTIERLRPSVIVEMGVWKGASTLFMAGKLRDHGIDGVVIAVDTWLGSSEHWLFPELGADLSMDRGYPRLFDKFSANVVACGLNDYVVPLPLDSASAATVVQHRLPPADMLHLDGGHDRASVVFDLMKWWAILRPGGTFIGDDYYDDGHWPDVKLATDSFLARVPHEGFEHENGKWRAVKT